MRVSARRLWPQSVYSLLNGKYLGLNANGLQYGDGTLFFTGDRENTSTVIEATDTGDIAKDANNSLQGTLKVTRKVGHQANGYVVKLAKESEAAALELLKPDNEAVTDKTE